MVRLPLALSLTLGLLVFSSSSSALASDEAGMGDNSRAQVTLTGEVVDLHCYMLNPDTGRGPDHAKCANSCIDRGLPAGLLADGKLYLLLGAGHDAATKLVAGLAGGSVTVVGSISDQGGMKALQIKTIDAMGAKPMSQTQPAEMKSHEDHKH